MSLSGSSEIMPPWKAEYVMNRSDIYKIGFPAKIREAYVPFIDFTKRFAGKKILDLGCGYGAYSYDLNKLGFKCIGADVNNEYIKVACEAGIEAYVIRDELPFEENFFDTVIIFEVLEHVHDPAKILIEAKRVAKKNILITVPNCGYIETLKSFGLTYDHFLAEDHVNFFTKDSLATLISKYFNNFEIMEGDRIAIKGKLIAPRLIQKLITLLSLTRVYKTSACIIDTGCYARLYTVINVNKG